MYLRGDILKLLYIIIGILSIAVSCYGLLMVTLRPRKISNAYYYTLTCILGASASLVATTFILGNWLMLNG